MRMSKLKVNAKLELGTTVMARRSQSQSRAMRVLKRIGRREAGVVDEVVQVMRTRESYWMQEAGVRSLKMSRGVRVRKRDEEPL